MFFFSLLFPKSSLVLFHLIVSWYLFISAAPVMTYMVERSAWVGWTCWPVPSWYLQIRLQGNGISCITRGPLKPSSLLWNALRPELFDQQTAAPQSAIAPHYPRSRASDSTWPRLDLLTQLIPGTTSPVLLPPPPPHRRAGGWAAASCTSQAIKSQRCGSSHVGFKRAQSHFNTGMTNGAFPRCHMIFALIPVMEVCGV